MVCCLLDMNEANELDTPYESEDWTTIINRGGLTHIRNMTYGMFELGTSD